MGRQAESDSGDGDNSSNFTFDALHLHGYPGELGVCSGRTFDGNSLPLLSGIDRIFFTDPVPGPAPRERASKG
jgi:hypothetical protein